MKYMIKDFENNILFKSDFLDDLIPLNMEGRLFVEDSEVCYVYTFESTTIRSVLMKIRNKIKNIEVRKHNLEKEMKLLEVLETL